MKERPPHPGQAPELRDAADDFPLPPGEAPNLGDVIVSVERAIEQARREKIIGHSLDARVTIAAPEKLRALLATHLEELRALLIVSQLVVAEEKDIAGAYKSEEIAGLAVGVEKARGTKCERCWIYEESVGENAQHPTICARCLENL